MRGGSLQLKNFKQWALNKKVCKVVQHHVEQCVCVFKMHLKDKYGIS